MRLAQQQRENHLLQNMATLAASCGARGRDMMAEARRSSGRGISWSMPSAQRSTAQFVSPSRFSLLDKSSTIPLAIQAWRVAPASSADPSAAGARPPLPALLRNRWLVLRQGALPSLGRLLERQERRR